MLKADESKAMFASEKMTLADRQLFVHNLGVLLSQTREGVEACTLDEQENVHIRFTNGFERTVCVECDSYMAIVRDVSRKI